MSHLTKAQKESQQLNKMIDEVMEEQRVAHERVAEYPAALMTLLAEATSAENDFSLKVRFNTFFIVDRKTQNDFNLSLTYDPNYSDDFAELGRALDQARFARDEKARKQNIRENALAKLTEEERAVLGL